MSTCADPGVATSLVGMPALRIQREDLQPVLSAHRGRAPFLVGARLTYADLSLFQLVAGLRYAFPRRMKAFEREIPRLVELHDRVAARPNIKAYLASDRRIAFNEDGIFRRYKELDI